MPKGPEPILIKKGDNRVMLNDGPPQADCRVVAEEYYQELLKEIEDLKEAQNEYNKVISFALDEQATDYCSIEFLRLWNEGGYSQIKKEFPEFYEEEEDPLHEEKYWVLCITTGKQHVFYKEEDAIEFASRPDTQSIVEDKSGMRYVYNYEIGRYGQSYEDLTREIIRGQAFERDIAE